MSEEQERLLREGDGFLSSQVSFDLEGPRKPVRRKSKKDDSEGASAEDILEPSHSTNISNHTTYTEGKKQNKKVIKWTLKKCKNCHERIRSKNHMKYCKLYSRYLKKTSEGYECQFCSLIKQRQLEF